MSPSKNNTSTRKDKNYHLKILEDTPEWSSAASRPRANSVMAPPPEPKLTLRLRSARSSTLDPRKLSNTPQQRSGAKSVIPLACITRSKKARPRIKIDMTLAWAQDVIELCRQVKDHHESVLRNRASMTEDRFLGLQGQCLELRHEVCKHILAHRMVRHFPRVRNLLTTLVQWELARQSK